MSLIPYRYLFLRHIALAGSQESFPFGFWLKRYECTLFTRHDYHPSDRHLGYLERQLHKIVHPDPPTLLQFLREQLDLLEIYIEEQHVKPLLQHIREEKYVPRLETFVREKLNREPEDYYAKWRQYYLEYEVAREYYGYHLKQYYIHSIYNPTLHSRGVFDLCVEIGYPFARPYLENYTVDVALIVLAFLSRIPYFLPIPWEYPPVDLSTSGLKLFDHNPPEELKWWQKIGFNIHKTFELYGYYSSHLPYF